MRRLDNLTNYQIETKKGKYVVIVERLRNDVNGVPRYKFLITMLHGFEDYTPTYTYVFTMKGHYEGESGEVKSAIRYFEENILK